MGFYGVLSLGFFLVGFIGLFILIKFERKRSIEDILKDYNKWASNQFPNSTAISSLIGLKREIEEVIEEINLESFYHDKERLAIEYADCLMYIIDSSRRSGIDEAELFMYFDKKLEINKKRDWKINNDKSYSHIK